LHPHAAMRKDRRGNLPLHYGARNQAAAGAEIVNHLLHLHPDGAEMEDREFALPLHHACLNEGPAAIEIVHMLIKACTQWDGGLKKKDREGRIPLHYSCMNESELGDNITEELVERWPEAASIPDRDGKLPLHLCAFNACQMRLVADVAIDTFEHLMDAFPGAVYHEDRDERLPLHYACMNLGPVAQYLVNELAHADNDGANKYDRYGKLPLQYARENQGLAAKQAYWKTLETTMLLKTKDYVKGDEVGEFLGIDRDEYSTHLAHGTFSLDAKNPSNRYSMSTHSRDDNLQR